MIRHGYDETNGIVIGELTASYRIYYDNRKQHEWTDRLMSDRKAKEKAQKWINKQKEEGEMLFNRLYPEKKWEIKIPG